MRFAAKNLFFTFILTLLFFTACGVAENNTNSQDSEINSISANNDAKSAKDETLDLGKIINLPHTPEETVFREDDLTKPANSDDKNAKPIVTGKKLTAVLQFTEEDTEQIIAQAKKIKSPVANELAPESWFPPELVAASQSTGDEMIKGKAYAADAFYKPPYNNGKITRINDTDYFVLELFAK